MDKEAVVHIHMEYYSAIKRNAFEAVPMRWVNLEPSIQSEVSQKEKAKCHIQHYFANKGPSSQGYGFSSGHV